MLAHRVENNSEKWLPEWQKAPLCMHVSKENRKNCEEIVKNCGVLIKTKPLGATVDHSF
jgi:hypothetical protein